jgi:hypothetical protein
MSQQLQTQNVQFNYVQNQCAQFNGQLQNVYNNILAAANFVINNNQGTFQSGQFAGVDFWAAASDVYPNPFVADTWYAFTGYTSYFTPAQIKAWVQVVIAARDGNGNLPVSINSVTAAGDLYYTGSSDQEFLQPGQSNFYHTTGDPVWFIPMCIQLYYQLTDDLSLFTANSAVLKTAFQAIPVNPTTKLVNSPQLTPWTPWGFNDGVIDGGDVCMGSLLYWKTANVMSAMYALVGDVANASLFAGYAANIKNNLAAQLWNSGAGMFNHDTLNNVQIDILASAYAVYIGFATPAQAAAISQYLVSNYSTITSMGFIRQSPIDWTVQCNLNYLKGTYDDAYWSVGNAWVYTAMAVTSINTANAYLAAFSHASPSMYVEYVGGNQELRAPATRNMESPCGALSVCPLGLTG